MPCSRLRKYRGAGGSGNAGRNPEHRTTCTAQTAAIKVCTEASGLRILIDDDGIGFSDPNIQPWSIASRVAEYGGHLKLANTDRPGAHLEIEIPLK